MVAVNLPLEPTSDTAMFLRLWDARKLSPTLARHLLELEWSPNDESRMRELRDKNRKGEIDAGELRELDNYVRIGTMLSILQSRARKTLKSPSKSRKSV